MVFLVVVSVTEDIFGVVLVLVFVTECKVIVFVIVMVVFIFVRLLVVVVFDIVFGPVVVFDEDLSLLVVLIIFVGDVGSSVLDAVEVWIVVV